MSAKAKVKQAIPLPPDAAGTLGQAATSRAGRDAGRTFLVVGVEDETYVFVADGCLRKMARPKRKKRKHLDFLGVCAQEIKGMLLEGKAVGDAQVRKSLTALGYEPKRVIKEG